MAGAAEEEIVDRLSGLPDDILRHILSFLPSHYSMRTSLLSTRFRYLWRSVPVLDFCDNYYPIKTFAKIVDDALNNHEYLPRVRKLRLWCFDFIYKRTTISKWIDLFATSTSSNLEELDIHIYELPPSPSPVNLSSAVFSCSKLKTIKLSGGIRIDYIPDHVFFPCLKTLRLKSISMVGCNTLKKLLSSCPACEIFHIKDCLIERTSNTYSYDNFTIRRLYLEYQLIHADSDRVNNRVLSQASASILLIHNSLTFALLKTISTMVKQLEICKPINVKYIRSDDCIDPPVWQNLTHLVVKAKRDMYASPILPFILKHSPNLSCLVLKKEYGYENLSTNTRVILPTISYYSLEIVEINGFIGLMEDMEVVKYFLKNALMLKKLVLSVRRSVISNEVKASVLDQPRASTQCEIQFIHSIN